MRLHIWSSFFIFWSAYSPLSIILLFQDYNYSTCHFSHPWVSLPLFAASIFSIVILFLSLKAIVFADVPVRIESVRFESGQLVNYAIPYMITFFVMDIGDTGLLLSFAFFMIIMYLLTLRTHNVFVNPILALVGYNLYEVSYSRNGITKTNIFLYRGEIPALGSMYRIEKIAAQMYLAKLFEKDQDHATIG